MGSPQYQPDSSSQGFLQLAHCGGVAWAWVRMRTTKPSARVPIWSLRRGFAFVRVSWPEASHTSLGSLGSAKAKSVPQF
jgi:hypothetical protein